MWYLRIIIKDKFIDQLKNCHQLQISTAIQKIEATQNNYNQKIEKTTETKYSVQHKHSKITFIYSHNDD